MYNFSNELPKESNRPGIALVRTPAARPMVAIVTSDDLVGTPTHWYHNRTTPCEGEGCPMCADGHFWRWHGYLSCVDEMTHEHVLFEMTANAAESFRAYRKEYGTLRGCLFKATRAAGRYNGRVTIQTRPADLAGRSLPPTANLVTMLCHIWQIAMPEAEIKGRQKDHPRIRVAKETVPSGNNR